MGGKKTIALLVGQADEEYQSNFINGFLSEAHSLGYNVAVFSMLYKYQNTVEQDQGDYNIFTLIPFLKIDAVVVLCDSIQSSGSIDKLMQEIKKNFKGPVLNIDGNYDVPTQRSKSSKSILALLTHLKEVHNITDIAFLNGRIEHPFSKDRFEDYKAGLENLGIPYDDNKVYYGDFWYSSGENMVEKILRKGDKLPRAILCANDCMAIGVCKALEKRGINVPNDVAVVSYDTSDEGRTSPVPITSAYIQAKHTGTKAAKNIFSLMNGGEVYQDEPEAELFMGESCGCNNENCHYIDARRKYWDTEKSRIGFESPYNNIMDDLFEQDRLEDYINSVYSYLYQIGDYKNFYLCLNDDWLTPEKLRDNVIRRKGYADRMIAVIDANDDMSRPDKVGFGVMFDREQLLPADAWFTDEEMTYFFTPIYHQNRVFGYAALRYSNATVSYDGIYRMWIKLVSRGLEMIRRQECGHIMMEEVKEAAAEAAANVNPNVSYEDNEMMEQVKKLLDNNAFDYKFQPIVSAKDGQIYAYEALMRSKSKKIDPLMIIKYAEMMGRLGDIEKYTFLNVLGIFKARKDEFEGKKVFINSIPGVKVDDETHDSIVKVLRSNPNKVVIELTEKAELDDDQLDAIKKEYFTDGVQMAIDDYGTGYSNVSNLLRYMPDYVKIDRALLSGIQDDMQKQHFVREIVEFSHENNIKTLAEGVETREELETVIKMDVDLIQGFYTARPYYDPIAEIEKNVVKEILRFRREKEDGVDQQVYIAGRTNRISLMNLIKDETSTIRIGTAGATHRDLTILGTPGFNTEIHVEIEDNYKGQITLENAGLSNIKTRPSIEIGSNCDVTIVLKGENVLRGGGIQVPETSKLTFEGEGNLNIAVNDNNYYCIGNDMNSRHGDIIFEQDGAIIIEANGRIGAGIGSGLGGKIDVRKGKFELSQSGDEGVVIGSIEGDTDISIDCSDMSIFCSLSMCACVGSLRGNNKVFVHKSYFRCDTGGNTAAAVGSIGKGRTDFKCEEADMHVNVNGPKVTTVIGSLEGDSNIVITHAGLYVKEEGDKALVFGGTDGDIKIAFDHVNFKASVESSYDEITFARKQDFSVVNGAWKVDMIKK